MLEHDVESFSPAGYVWDPESNKWQPPHGASATSKGLPGVGAHVYWEHPEARVLIMRYRWTEWPAGYTRRWLPGEPCPQEIADWVNAGGAIEAHNSMFERLAWHHDLTPRHGFPTVQPEQWHCSAATARVSALPGALEKLGDALGTDTKKDADGKRLMKKFSILRNPSKKDPRTLTPTPSTAEIKAFESLPDDGVSRQLALDGYLLEGVIEDTEVLREFLAYDDYCADDVLTEADAMRRMAPMTPDERRFWLIDQEINWRGIAIDRKGVRDCIAVLDEALEQYGDECCEITGGIGPSQVQQLLGWVNGRMTGLDDHVPF